MRDFTPRLDNGAIEARCLSGMTLELLVNADVVAFAGQAVRYISLGDEVTARIRAYFEIREQIDLTATRLFAHPREAVELALSFLKHKDRRLTCQLNKVASWIPGKHREEILSDLWEDCEDRLDRGFTARQIRRHVRWEVIRTIVAHWCDVVVSYGTKLIGRVTS